ncbi:hypothetical protein [Mycobacterium sp. NPDC050853]|uniref:hypothetical protein n=1 Tax=Mycobacterium sp. NPDC050853 TaxID=3155160 RepID=UPI0033E0D93E
MAADETPQIGALVAVAIFGEYPFSVCQCGAVIVGKRRVFDHYRLRHVIPAPEGGIGIMRAVNLFRRVFRDYGDVQGLGLIRKPRYSIHSETSASRNEATVSLEPVKFGDDHMTFA